jgi:hypothetical protein
MNSKKLVRSSVLTVLGALLAIAAPGCLDIQTTTVVHRNKSLSRTVTFSGDSASIGPARLVLGIDSAWGVETGREEKKQTLTAHRNFADIEEMSRALHGIPGRSLTILPRLETRFNWFFTTYRYHETWSRLHTVNEVPLSDFVSSGEIALFTRHELEKKPFPTKGDSLALADAEDRYREWDARNWFEAYFRILMDGARELHDPLLSPDSLAARKEFLYREARDRFGLISESKNPRDLGSIAGEFARLLKNPLALKAAALKAEEISALASQQNFVENFTPYGYQVAVEMPGLITNTNANAINGSLVSWSGFAEVLYFTEYDMWVESSVVNWWAIIISALLLLLVVVLAIAGIVRGKRVALAA